MCPTGDFEPTVNLTVDRLVGVVIRSTWNKIVPTMVKALVFKAHNSKLMLLWMEFVRPAQKSGHGLRRLRDD